MPTSAASAHTRLTESVIYRPTDPCRLVSSAATSQQESPAGGADGAIFQEDVVKMKREVSDAEMVSDSACCSRETLAGGGITSTRVNMEISKL